jgi:hypothetical protein
MKPARAGSLRLLDSLANMRPLSVLLSGEIVMFLEIEAGTGTPLSVGLPPIGI